MKKFVLILALATLATGPITFAADTKAPAEKPKSDAKCDDDSCCDEPKAVDTKDAKAPDANANAKKSDPAKTVAKK